MSGQRLAITVTSAAKPSEEAAQPLRADKVNEEIISAPAEAAPAPATAAAPPPSEPAPTRSHARAAGAPSAEGDDSTYQNWLADVRAALAAGKVYPPRARLQGREGRVEIRFRVTTDGRLTATEVLQSSGHRLLDQAALALARSVRVPPPPSAAAAREALTFTLDYALDRQAASAACRGCNNSG